MKFTKFGHSCVLIQEGNVRTLLDPGSYSTGQNDVHDIDIVVITHEHQDHLDMDSLRAVLRNNPKVKVITNTAVGALLKKEGIPFSVVEDGRQLEEKGMSIEGVGEKHALIHSSIALAQNTGYFLAGKFFYPGDALTLPSKSVEILGLPAAAPWAKISEIIDYALAVRPRVCIPLHDGILRTPGMMGALVGRILEPAGIRFMQLELNREYEL